MTSVAHSGTMAMNSHTSLTPLSNPVPGVDVSQLLERVSSLEQSVRSLISGKKRTSSQQHLLQLEQQLETCSSPRLRDLPRLYPSTYGPNVHPPVPCVFQVPLHYPRFSRADYETMEEWRLDRLLDEYGIPLPATLDEKREAAIGNFLWEKPIRQ